MLSARAIRLLAAPELSLFSENDPCRCVGGREADASSLITAKSTELMLSSLE